MCILEVVSVVYVMARLNSVSVSDHVPVFILLVDLMVYTIIVCCHIDVISAVIVVGGVVVVVVVVDVVVVIVVVNVAVVVISHMTP